MIPPKPDGSIDLLLSQLREGLIAQNIRVRHTFMYTHTHTHTHKASDTWKCIRFNPI